MKISTLFLSPLTLLLSLSLFFPASQPTAEAYTKKRLVCAFVPRIMSRYLKHHVMVKSRDINNLPAQMRHRTLESYVKRINPSKSLLTGREVKQIKKNVSKIFNTMTAADPDCSSLFTAQKVIVENSTLAENHVKKNRGQSQI